MIQGINGKSYTEIYGPKSRTVSGNESFNVVFIKNVNVQVYGVWIYVDNTDDGETNGNWFLQERLFYTSSSFDNDELSININKKISTTTSLNNIGIASDLIGLQAANINNNNKNKNKSEFNLFMGYMSGSKFLYGQQNTILGYKASEETISGSEITVLGYQAGKDAKHLSSVVLIGTNAGRKLTNDEFNGSRDTVIIGNNAAGGSDVGYRNICNQSVGIGFEAGHYGYSANINSNDTHKIEDTVMLGYQVGTGMEMNGCTLTGYKSGYNDNYTGYVHKKLTLCSLYGKESGFRMKGERNICLGQSTGKHLSGNDNIIIGCTKEYISGDNNILIGNGNLIGDNITNITNKLIIGNGSSHLIEGDIANSSVSINGSLAATTTTFRIEHPTKEDYYLYHSAVETPTAGDNIYRFTVSTVNNKCSISLDEYIQVLNENIMIWVSPKEHFGNAYGVVSNNTLEVTSNEDGVYNVLFIGTRKDPAAKVSWKGHDVPK